MSMELYVLSDRQLASIDDWQKAVDEDGRRLRLSDEGSFADLSGALPVVLDGVETAFECDHWDVDDAIDGLPDMQLEHPWKFALAFRWGGDFDAAVAAYAAAASYARATGGVILDCEEGKIISPQRALEISAEIAGSRSQIEAAMWMVIEKFKNGQS